LPPKETEAEKQIFDILFKSSPVTYHVGGVSPRDLEKDAEANLQIEAHRSFITKTLKKRANIDSR